MGFIKGMDPKNKGKVLEYTGDEKIDKGLRKIFGTTVNDRYLIVDKIEISSKQIVPRSTAIGDGFQNNDYLVFGKVWYKPFDVILDRILPSKESKFEIKFNDTRDAIGLPDIAITVYQLLS